LYGSLSQPSLRSNFFSGLVAGSAFIFALLAFTAGFIGAAFRRWCSATSGDAKVGPEYTFLLTIVIMGLSTFIVGLAYALPLCTPGHLIALRMLPKFGAGW
jgi:hypothetical protein